MLSRINNEITRRQEERALNTEVESTSEELIIAMERLEIKVRESFKETDALLNSFGINRSNIHEIINTAKRQMTEDDKKGLEKYEEELELKTRVDEAHQLSENPVKASKKRMRTSLAGKV